jgi:tetratricopeptide (TPR) repeat protein
MRYVWSVLVAAPLIMSCAARSNAVPTAAAQAQADELVRQGCYDCLLDARAIYERMPPGVARKLAIRRFEIELLLASRERELAIDPAATLTRARAIAADLGTAIDAARYVAIVEATPPDRVGIPANRRLLSPLTAGREGLGATLSVIAASPFSALVRSYLAASIECGRPPAELAQLPPRATDDATAPLLLYRRAMCDPIDSEALERVRGAVPRFAETGLFLGRRAMGSFLNSDGSKARGHFLDAYGRFPNSPAVTFHLATIEQASGDCRRAEGYFTETLAIYSDHEEARLGRAVCRTYLSNADGAIADATVLIDAQASNRADGYYWRAWNRRSQKQIDLARADIDNARALRYNARVLTLAGMIEHDQGEFAKAKEDLTRASEMDTRECQARWYLGLVGFATEQWPDSAGGFADAADCYSRLIAETEAKRDEMARRDDVSEAFRRSQIAGFNAAIAEDSTQRSAADLNAAINYARAGQVDNATTYMKRAWVDPERRATIEDLRQVLGIPRWQ